MIIRTLFEVVLVGFAIWALFNEDKFVRFEEKLIAKLKGNQ